MKAHPYLNFGGDCGDAFRFYQQVLGGKLEVMTFADAPMPGTPPGWDDRVMHACLMTGDVVLMASDAPPEHFSRPAGMYVSLHVDDVAEAERVWAAFAQGGTVAMPLEKTFWAERFGMLSDRFGTPWMINCTPTPAA